MLGLQDPWIILAYLLTIISAIFTTVYGILNWNKNGEKITEEDKKWYEEEIKIEEEL